MPDERNAAGPDAGEPKSIGSDELDGALASGAQLVDVRSDHEWEAGHLAGATHIKLEDLSDDREQVDRSRPVIFYCRGDNRCRMAAQAFDEDGYDARFLEGGIVEWVERGRALEPADGRVADLGVAADLLHQRGSLPPPG